MNKDYIELNKKNTEILINEATSNKYKKLENNRYSIQLNMLKKHVDKSKAFLDIGIRDGAFISFLKTNGFTNLYGVDVYDRSIEIAKEKGIDCEVADVHTMNLNKKFDTVMMSHVLEHCPYPDKVLENIYNHINVGGILFIEVPIELGDPKPTEKDAHYFNFHSLDDLLKILGRKWKILEKAVSARRIKVVLRRL